MSITITGTGGRLKSGSRIVTALGVWTAESIGNNQARVTVTTHTPDPFYWEHHNPAKLKLFLPFGRNELRGSAVLVAAEPLILEFTQDEEEA